MIICLKCNKEKEHFGLKMCSACLRHYKRQTRPSFYLATCYSELCRRIKTYDPLRPNYFGKEKCSKKEFISKFINDWNFHKIYELWQNSGYKRKYAPSIDRIDFNKGYTLDNMVFIPQNINSNKEKKIKILLEKDGYEFCFESCSLAARFLGLNPSYFCRIRKQSNNYNGYNINEL